MKIRYFYDFLNISHNFTISADLTLKMTSKVKSEGCCLLFGYMFGVVYYRMSLPKSYISLRNVDAATFCCVVNTLNSISQEPINLWTWYSYLPLIGLLGMFLHYNSGSALNSFLWTDRSVPGVKFNIGWPRTWPI